MAYEPLRLNHSYFRLIKKWEHSNDSLITLSQSNLVAMFFIAAFIWKIGPWAIWYNWNCSKHTKVDKTAFIGALWLKLCYDEVVTTLKKDCLPAGSSKTGNEVTNRQENTLFGNFYLKTLSACTWKLPVHKTQRYPLPLLTTQQEASLPFRLKLFTL